MSPHPDRPALLAAIVCGQVDRVRAHPTLVDLELIDEAEDHGVTGLVRHRLQTERAWTAIDTATRGAIDALVRQNACSEAFGRRQVVQVVRALRDAGVPVISFKGAALAYTHYPAPYLRPRCDTDLLVRPADVARATHVLESLGYSRVAMVARDLVHAQSVFTREGDEPLAIDLHWRVSNRPFFASTLTFDELARDAVTVEALAPSVLAPSAVHALLLACIHRVAHHNSTDRLIWLYDITLLAEHLSERQWDDFARLADEKAVGGICAAGIGLATGRFGSSALVARHLDSLRIAADARPEPSAVYINPRRGSVQKIVLDARHAGGWYQSAQVLASHMFPDAAYMRQTYGASTATGLARAYARRVGQGLHRLASTPVR